ncbi:MAG: LysR family transcriptional regulator [Oceanobacter sp.]
MAGWEGIREFVAVAEQGGFTRAAERLGISVAQVSRQVSALEDRLNTELLHRTTRKVTLTEAGQRFFQHCQPLLEGLTEAERAVSSYQQNPVGEIKLTAPITMGESQIAPLLLSFMQQYPKINVRLNLTNQTLDLLEGGYDLAIRIGKLPDSSLKARQLSSRSLHLCASPDYLAQHGHPHTLNELGRHNCLLGTLDYWRFVERSHGQEKERLLRVNGSLRINSGHALKDAALQGIGMVQLPEFYVADDLASGRLIEVLPAYRPSNESIWAVYPGTRHLSTKIRLLVDHLVQELNADRPND